MLLTFLLACAPDGTDSPCTRCTDDTAADADPDTDSDSDADADSDTDSDTDADLVVTDASWRLHPDIESVAYVGWAQDGPGRVQIAYSFDDGVWLESPEVNRAAGPNEQILLGIPYEAHVSWQILAEGALAAEGELDTGPLPGRLPLPTLEVGEATAWWSDGNYLLTSVDEDAGGWTGGPFWTVIFDRSGRVVWARRSEDWTLFAQVSASTGTEILIDEDTAYTRFDHGEASRILRWTLEGQVSETPAPGLEHPFVELPDGTLAWGSRTADPTEALVELAPDASEPAILWTCAADWLGSGDCDSNGLFYDALTDTYLYSFWTNDAVVSIDRATGTSLWWAGGVSGGFRFDPPGSRFSLQHGVSYTDTRTLLLSTEADGPSTWVREYEVDTKARMLREVWSFDSGVYAETNGDALRLGNGNTLHVVGSAGVIDEVTADGEVVWQLDWGEERLLGLGEFIEELYALVAVSE